MITLLIVLASVTVVLVVLMVTVLSIAVAHRRQYLEDIAASRFPATYPVESVNTPGEKSRPKASKRRPSQMGRRPNRTALSLH